MAATRSTGAALGRERRRVAVARCVRSGSPLRQPAPPAAPHRTALSGPARPGTMTVTRLDQGQRYRPRMAFLKKVRAEQRRETAAPLWASARHLGTAAGRGDALPGAPGWGGDGTTTTPVFVASCPAKAPRGSSGCVESEG